MSFQLTVVLLLFFLKNDILVVTYFLIFFTNLMLKLSIYRFSILNENASLTKIQSTFSSALAFDLTQNCQIER